MMYNNVGDLDDDGYNEDDYNDDDGIDVLVRIVITKWLL